MIAAREDTPSTNKFLENWDGQIAIIRSAGNLPTTKVQQGGQNCPPYVTPIRFNYPSSAH
jgi:hypothetical protein